MKKMTWKQVKGLTWFCIVYALSRLFLSLPSLEAQGEEIFIIFLTAMTFAWLVYTGLRSNQALLGFSISVAVIAAGISLVWGDFGRIEAFYGLIILGGGSLLTAILVLTYRVKTNKEWLVPLVLHLFGTIAIFIIMEYLVLPLIY